MSFIFALVFAFCAITAANNDAHAFDSIYKNEKYERIPSFDDMDKEVDRILLGITKQVNSRFDPYGNEIRRHMERVGSVDIMLQVTAREKQYEQVQITRQILQNWKTHMGGEIISVEKRIEAAPKSERERLYIKLDDNLKVVANFYQLMDLWTKANLDILTFLQLSQDEFDPIKPMQGFKNPETQDTFNTLLKKRNKARDNIRAYPSFSQIQY